MARKSKNSLVPASLVNEAPVQALVDHHSQIANWSAPVDAMSEIASEPEMLKTIIDQTDAEPTDAELAAIEAQAREKVSILPATSTVLETPASATSESFDDLVNSFTDEEVKAMIEKSVRCVDDRVAFEFAKNPDNENIQSTMKKVRALMTSSCVARVMLAANMDPSFINRMLHDGSRYNVYAIGKFGDAVNGLTGAGIGNAINNACMRSLFNFHAAGLDFTGDMARAAASDKIRVADAVRKHLVRHTVSASTAPTQASSTMQALETLGIVKVEGSRRNPVYRLTDAPITRKLKAVLAA